MGAIFKKGDEGILTRHEVSQRIAEATKAVERLVALASTFDRYTDYAAVHGLIQIGNKACSGIENLYQEERSRAIVQQVASRGDHFPVRVNNIPFDAGVHTSGEDIIAHEIKDHLMPTILRSHKGQKGQKAHEGGMKTLRVNIHVFHRKLRYPKLFKDISPEMATQWSNAPTLKTFLQLFEQWMRATSPQLVESPKGRLYNLVSQRQAALARHDASNADTWRALKALVRDQIKTSFPKRKVS